MIGSRYFVDLCRPTFLKLAIIISIDTNYSAPVEVSGVGIGFDVGQYVCRVLLTALLASTEVAVTRWRNCHAARFSVTSNSPAIFIAAFPWRFLFLLGSGWPRAGVDYTSRYAIDWWLGRACSTAHTPSAAVTSTVRLRFDGCSTAYRTSQWRSTSVSADPLATVAYLFI